jgi:hypothetical protein
MGVVYKKASACRFVAQVSTDEVARTHFNVSNGARCFPLNHPNILRFLTSAGKKESRIASYLDAGRSSTISSNGLGNGRADRLAIEDLGTGGGA